MGSHGQQQRGDDHGAGAASYCGRQGSRGHESDVVCEMHRGALGQRHTEPGEAFFERRPVRLSGGSDNGFGSALEAGPTEASSSSRAAYDDHGRHHFAAEKLAVIEQDDPFKLIFVVRCRSGASLPLIVGIFVALVMANAAPKTPSTTSRRRGTLGSGSGTTDTALTNTAITASQRRRREDCDKKRWCLRLPDVFDHHWTLHFLANDVVMSFHFALAMKEVTEALLPAAPSTRRPRR